MLALLLAPHTAQGAPNRTTISAPTQTLDFGSFVVLPTCINCSITISASGVRTASGGIVLTSNNTGRPAKFNVGCNNGACAYTAAITSSVNMAAGGVTMIVGTFSNSQSAPATPNVLSVGGKLTIPSAGSAVGTYTSSNFFVTTTP
jgi:3D (Asp-Asp-Asp) domain-containing protein